VRRRFHPSAIKLGLESLDLIGEGVPSATGAISLVAWWNPTKQELEDTTLSPVAAWRVG